MVFIYLVMLKKQENYGIQFDENKINWIAKIIIGMRSKIMRDNVPQKIVKLEPSANFDPHSSGSNQGKITDLPQIITDGLKGIKGIKRFKAGVKGALSIASSVQEKAKNEYKKQLTKLGFVAPSIFNEEDLMLFFAVQYAYDEIPFLDFLADPYNKEKTDKFMANMVKIKPEKTKKLQNAIDAYNKYIMKPFPSPSQYKINDDINSVVNYFDAVQYFVCTYLAKKSKKQVPFQIDLLLTVDTGTNYMKDINIKEKLIEAHCNYYPDDEKIQVSINSNEKNKLKLKRVIQDTYNEFYKNVVDDEKSDSSMQRFEIFIDRRDKTDNNDKLIMFESPEGCNKFPQKYLPEFHIELVNRCLIPGKDMNTHKTASDKLGGELLTFSFQVRSTKDIRCLLIWNGETTRFYGQYITQILCDLFTNVDKQFRNDKTIKKLEKNIGNHIKCNFAVGI
eukprot:384746_1